MLDVAKTNFQKRVIIIPATFILKVIVCDNYCNYFNCLLLEPRCIWTAEKQNPLESERERDCKEVLYVEHDGTKLVNNERVRERNASKSEWDQSVKVWKKERECVCKRVVTVNWEKMCEVLLYYTLTVLPKMVGNSVRERNVETISQCYKIYSRYSL